MDKKEDKNCCCPALEGFGMLIADFFGVGPLSKFKAQIEEEKGKERKRRAEELKNRLPILGELIFATILSVFGLIFILTLTMFEEMNRTFITLGFSSLMICTIIGISKIALLLSKRADKKFSSRAERRKR